MRSSAGFEIRSRDSSANRSYEVRDSANIYNRGVEARVYLNGEDCEHGRAIQVLVDDHLSYPWLEELRRRAVLSKCLFPELLRQRPVFFPPAPAQRRQHAGEVAPRSEQYT